MLYYQYFENYINSSLSETENRFNAFKNFIVTNNYVFNSNLLTLVETKINLIKQRNIFHFEDGFQNEILFRTLLQEIALINTEFDWRSASYQNSIYVNNYNLDNLQKNDVNYNRYSGKYIRKIEKYLLELYNMNSDYSCLVTSSGMSAYSIVEGLISRYIYEKNDSIFVPGYIYFESYEQLSRLKQIGLNVINGDPKDFNEDGILEYIYTNEPKFVFIDAILNTSDIKLIDINLILNNLNDNYTKEIFIITDITMSGIDINLNNYHNLNIIIYGSASKYLFNGLDISMMGFVFINNKYYNSAERQRRNLGGILYDYQALCFPLLGKDFYNNRLTVINSDAKYFYSFLTKDSEILQKYNIYYAGEHLFKRGKKFGGSIVTINFKQTTFQNQEHYSKLIALLINEASASATPLIEGVSFGFGITRVSASDVMSKGEPPFLRVSIGPSYYNDISKVSKIFQKVLKSYH